MNTREFEQPTRELRPTELLAFSHVVYSGGSRKRRQILELVAQSQVPVYSVPLTEEPLLDARGVLEYKLDQASNIGNGALIVAADTQALLPLKEGGFVNKTKPVDWAEIKANLSALANVGYYAVETASGSRHLGTTTYGFMRCEIRLDKEFLEFLNTQEGWETYLQTASQFYSEPPYTTNGFGKDNLLKFSGGFSVPVFIQLGGVKEINGNSLSVGKEERFNLIRGGIYTVAAGIGLNVLEQINPEASLVLESWPWLTETAQKLS